MLIDVATGKRITKMPFAREFDLMRSKLSEEDFDRVIARINELIDDGRQEIATAGWLPGSDWTGTPFEPIYTKAASRNYSCPPGSSDSRSGTRSRTAKSAGPRAATNVRTGETSGREPTFASTEIDHESRPLQHRVTEFVGERAEFADGEAPPRI